MISALLTFLGGSAFRLLWGEISHWITARQDHAFELDRLRLQAELDQAAHQRTQDALRLQAELGIKTIEAQAEAAISREDAAGFYAGSVQAMKSIGVAWVDAWNGAIRPMIASVCVVLWFSALWQAGFVVGDWDRDLIAGVFGFFFASRELAKRGK